MYYGATVDDAVAARTAVDEEELREQCRLELSTAVKQAVSAERQERQKQRLAFLQAAKAAMEERRQEYRRECEKYFAESAAFQAMCSEEAFRAREEQIRKSAEAAKAEAERERQANEQYKRKVGEAREKGSNVCMTVPEPSSRDFLSLASWCHSLLPTATVFSPYHDRNYASPCQPPPFGPPVDVGHEHGAPGISRVRKGGRKPEKNEDEDESPGKLSRHWSLPSFQQLLILRRNMRQWWPRSSLSGVSSQQRWHRKQHLSASLRLPDSRPRIRGGRRNWQKRRPSCSSCSALSLKGGRGAKSIACSRGGKREAEDPLLPSC